MRGKLGAFHGRHILSGNIPAYAGKTIIYVPFNSYSTEHPRVCGENCGPLKHMLITVGTSPRMRGKLTREMLGNVILGNIPAYAGKTTSIPSV